MYMNHIHVRELGECIKYIDDFHIYYDLISTMWNVVKERNMENKETKGTFVEIQVEDFAILVLHLTSPHS